MLAFKMNQKKIEIICRHTSARSAKPLLLNRAELVYHTQCRQYIGALNNNFSKRVPACLPSLTQMWKCELWKKSKNIFARAWHPSSVKPKYTKKKKLNKHDEKIAHNVWRTVMNPGWRWCWSSIEHNSVAGSSRWRSCYSSLWLADWLAGEYIFGRTI